MSLHMDENAIKAHAEQIASKATRRKSRKIWAFSAVGTVLAGGAAFAAVQLFGFGSINQSASTLKNLKVENARLTGTLAPGQSVAGAADVYNENDFPVTISGIILQDSSLQATGDGCDNAGITPGGKAVAAYPGQGGGAGHEITLKDPIELKAGGGVVLNVPGVVSQAASAEKLCGVKANFAVVAKVGN